MLSWASFRRRVSCWTVLKPLEKSKAMMTTYGLVEGSRVTVCKMYITTAMVEPDQSCPRVGLTQPVDNALKVFLKWYALYKFTFYLLTYLLTHGLGLVGLRWVEIFQFLVGWVNYNKNTKNLKGFVLAFWAAAEDILNISLNSLYLNDITTLFLICVMTFKNMRKYAWLIKSTK